MTLPKNKILELSNQDINFAPFLMIQSHPDDYSKNINQSQYKYYNNPDSTNYEYDRTASKLSKMFYDDKNISLIQKMIIHSVFKNTKGEYLIERQNPQDLMVVMMNVFSNYAKNIPDKLCQQVYELNEIVVDEVVPEIISQIKMNDVYLSDVFGLPDVLNLPKNMSSKGMKNISSFYRR